MPENTCNVGSWAPRRSRAKEGDNQLVHPVRRLLPKASRNLHAAVGAAVNEHCISTNVLAEAAQKLYDCGQWDAGRHKQHLTFTWQSYDSSYLL